MNCFFMHDWEKWEQYEEKGLEVLTQGSAAGKSFSCVYIRQKRKCKRCAKVQDELVR